VQLHFIASHKTLGPAPTSSSNTNNNSGVTNTQIGGQTILYVATTVTCSTSSATPMITFTNVPIGVWHISYQMQVGTSNGETAVLVYNTYISPSSPPTNTPTTYGTQGVTYNISLTPNTGIYTSGSAIINIASIQNVSVNMYASKQSGTATSFYIFGSSTNPSGHAIITRIA